MHVTLEAPRPLVRLFTPVEVPDDTVPPLLSFPEVEILHHRLVMIGDTANIRYLKWVCMSYAGALKQRNEASLCAEPDLFIVEECIVVEYPQGVSQCGLYCVSSI